MNQLYELLLQYTAINSYWTALADPAHCDQWGFPSCSDVGRTDGEERAYYDDIHGSMNHSSCPLGHSREYCQGFETAYGDYVNTLKWM